MYWCWLSQNEPLTSTGLDRRYDYPGLQYWIFLINRLTFPLFLFIPSTKKHKIELLLLAFHFYELPLAQSLNFFFKRACMEPVHVHRCWKCTIKPCRLLICDNFLEHIRVLKSAESNSWPNSRVLSLISAVEIIIINRFWKRGWHKWDYERTECGHYARSGGFSQCTCLSMQCYSQSKCWSTTMWTTNSHFWCSTNLN